MQVIVIKNTDTVSHTWGSRLYTANDTYTIPNEAERSRYLSDESFFTAVADGDALISKNGTDFDLSATEGWAWLSGNHIQEETDGRHVVHETPRKRGTYTYFTGTDDDHTDPTKYGGAETNVQVMEYHHEVSDAAEESFYIDFNTIVNESHVFSGILSWLGALNDMMTFEIVPKVTEYTSGTDTNYDLYGGVLIVPAAGNGSVSVDSGDIVLVQCVENEFGDKPAGFWDATFNTTTKVFDNITPNIYGTGEFNMFAVEMVMYRFMNKVLMLGEGTLDLDSRDTAGLGHGGRCKVTLKTRGTDHEWRWNATMKCFRKYTA